MSAVPSRLRVVSYNIHKGVQGLGPARRLEIHNLAKGVAALQADLICLQEVRRVNRREARRFSHWPELGQAEFLAPEGFACAYHTNAVTRHGEHGNAVLSRWPILSQHHEDISDHRFEQRGLLHAVVSLDEQPLHVVVVHLGLVRSSRVRQLAQVGRYLQREIDPQAPLLLAGDFNDIGLRLHDSLRGTGLSAWPGLPVATFPSRLPLLQLDHVFARGLSWASAAAPRGQPWWRMSDHLPLVAELVMPV